MTKSIDPAVEQSLNEAFIEPSRGTSANPANRFQTLSPDQQKMIDECLEGEDQYDVDRRAVQPTPTAP